ncbi:hypothetical protein DL96DRAFT_120351 [Flagelloscypha sp. PMI_526]|nr:hypothetical protein DL96DRAFT_120351 [Flagelloscypha sp. PMI_526]
MVVYTRPEIPPKNSYAPKTCAELSNPAVLYIPAETTRYNGLDMSQMALGAYPNRGYLPTNHQCFASIRSTESGNSLFELVEIVHAGSSSSTFAPLPLKRERSLYRYSEHLPIDENTGRADIDLDQNLMLHSLAEDATQIVFHLSLWNENGAGTELQRGVLYESDDKYRIRDFCLCPSAGRLCLLGPEGIEIVDFVESPNLKNIQTVQRTSIHSLNVCGSAITMIS